MPKDISIIGRGQTVFGELWDMNLPELIARATEAALKEAPCSVLDIDMVIVGNMLGEVMGSQAHLGALTASLLPHSPPALRVESACASGAVALHTAYSMLAGGSVRNVLVVGAEKMTDASGDAVAAALMGAADAEKDAPCGLTFPGLFGLVANRYMHDYGLTRDELSLVSSLHHAHGVKNPFAQFRSAVSPEAVSRSPLVSDPLRLLDCSPISDGAAAVVLSTQYQSPWRLRASQLATDSVSLTDRPTLTSFAATKKAVQHALAQSELTIEDMRHIELHDCFSIAALINVEDMGLAAPGEGVRLYRTPTSGPTLNLSGGLKACGHPVAATGVKQLVDMTKQLHASGERFGLTQNFGGACATCAVHIVEYSA